MGVPEREVAEVEGIGKENTDKYVLDRVCARIF